MSNKENGSTPGSGGGGSSTNQSNTSGTSSEAHQYVGPYRLEKTLGKGQTGKKLPLQFSSLIHFHRTKYSKKERRINTFINIYKSCFILIYGDFGLSLRSLSFL